MVPRRCILMTWQLWFSLKFFDNNWIMPWNFGANIFILWCTIRRLHIALDIWIYCMLHWKSLYKYVLTIDCMSYTVYMQGIFRRQSQFFCLHHSTWTELWSVNVKWFYLCLPWKERWGTSHKESQSKDESLISSTVWEEEHCSAPEEWNEEKSS